MLTMLEDYMISVDNTTYEKVPGMKVTVELSEIITHYLF